MTIWRRIGLALSIKAHRALDRAEDPRETFQYAWTQQLELLRKVRRGLVEVATSRHLLEGQARRLREAVPQLEDQAASALRGSREDLARCALARKHAAVSQLADLERQIAEVGEEERRLSVASDRLGVHVEQVRTRRRILSARYTASEAQVNVREALAGLSDELNGLWQALERAEDQTEHMRAHAAAIDALVEAGTLALPAAGGQPIDPELQGLETGEAVEQQLRKLRARLEEEQR